MKCKPCVVFVALYVVVVAAYTVYSYKTRETETLKRLDEKLYLVVSGIKHCLPNDFHDKAIGESDISPEADAKNVLALSEYARRMRVKYVYTLVKRDGMCFFTSSSCTDQELKKAVETPYFLPYTKASPATISAFEREVPTYATDTDRWGSFRSVLIPERSPKGRLYLAGADICTDYVDGLLRAHLLRSCVIGGMFILLMLPFIWIFKKSEREKINEFESLKELLHQQSLDKTTKIERKINEFLNK